jgi:hypothetical protein
MVRTTVMPDEIVMERLKALEGVCLEFSIPVSF